MFKLKKVTTGDALGISTSLFKWTLQSVIFLAVLSYAQVECQSIVWFLYLISKNVSDMFYEYSGIVCRWLYKQWRLSNFALD